jgi:PKD repeat protein
MLVLLLLTVTPQDPARALAVDLRAEDAQPWSPDDTSVSDTALDTGTTGTDTGAAPPDSGAPEEEDPPLVARLTVDVDAGEFPLTVSFDTSDSDLGTGNVSYEWAFGDGAHAFGEGSLVHDYIGRGEFEAVVTITDDSTGLVSIVGVTIDVDEPDCPSEEDPELLGSVDDDYDDLSGIAVSRLEPDLYWVLEDDDDDLRVLDSTGETVSEHDLPSSFEDIEDIAVVVDPTTGVSLLFVADIGDNDAVRDEIEVWIMEEPSPLVDSDLEPLRIELTYPDGSHDAETLLVDPLTMDLFIVTKDEPDEQSVYVKRAPHDDEGPFELDDLGDFSELDLSATAGDVSADGTRIIVRDYGDTARMFFRDGYEPFEEAFDDDPCRIEVDDRSRGEGIGFTSDGSGVVTIGEGDDPGLYYTAF